LGFREKPEREKKKKKDKKRGRVVGYYRVGPLCVASVMAQTSQHHEWEDGRRKEVSRISDGKRKTRWTREGGKIAETNIW